MNATLADPQQASKQLETGAPRLADLMTRERWIEVGRIVLTGLVAMLEAADIALMTDDLAKIVAARAIARRAYRTIQENLIVGVGVVHVCGITAALLGWIGPIQAAILHLGPDVLVFLNSVKLLRIRIKGA